MNKAIRALAIAGIALGAAYVGHEYRIADRAENLAASFFGTRKKAEVELPVNKANIELLISRLTPDERFGLYVDGSQSLPHLRQIDEINYLMHYLIEDSTEIKADPGERMALIGLFYRFQDNVMSMFPMYTPSRQDTITHGH